MTNDVEERNINNEYQDKSGRFEVYSTLRQIFDDSQTVVTIVVFNTHINTHTMSQRIYATVFDLSLAWQVLIKKKKETKTREK